LLWIALVPASTAQNAAFAAQLGTVSEGTALTWLALRALGATLIVPLAEELAFRGYLINVLSKRADSGEKTVSFALLPLLVSSVCFGALHSQWIAGILAGIAYGLARYVRGKVSDAVIAHAVTNGLLAAYVLTTQQWSYW
jgi:CAAX prenyl protease-like protein